MPKASKVSPKQVQAQAKGKAKATAKPTSQVSGKSAAKAKKVSPPVKAASKPIKKSQTSTATSASSKKSQRVSKPPKKANSPYQFFSNQMRTQMKSMEKFKSMTSTQQTTVIAESWKKLTEAQKKQYEDLGAEDKARYTKQQKQFEKNGYYLDASGRESRESGKKKVQSTKKVASSQKSGKKDEGRKSSRGAERIDETCKPKRVAITYLNFSNHHRPKLAEKHPDKTICDISKLIAEMWKTATDKEKQPFVKMQEEDRKRFEKEMKQFNELGYFINSDGIKSTLLDRKGKAKEFETGTVMPKRVRPAYFCFAYENTLRLRKEKPDMKITEITKAGGEAWAKMTEQQKKKYEDLHKKDQKRYDDQMAELRKKGFFMTADGVKSTDLPYKAPKKKRMPKRADKTTE